MKEFAELIFQEGNELIRKAYIKGAAKAARPLLAENAGLKAWKKEAEKKLASNFWDSLLKTVLFMAGGVAAGFTIGVLVK